MTLLTLLAVWDLGRPTSPGDNKKISVVTLIPFSLKKKWNGAIERIIGKSVREEESS